MIKILFFIESLNGGGAEKVLRTLVNHMDLKQFDVTVQTVYCDENEALLKEGIHYKYMYRKNDRFTEMRYRIEAQAGLAYPLHIKDDYDIEVAYLECASTKIMAASTNKKARKIAWVHCDLLNAFGEETSGFVEKTKEWYGRYDKVVCVSKQVKDSFMKLFGKSPDSVVIYNTVDSKEIIEKSKVALPDHITKRKKTVLMVGRLSYPKNIIRLLKTHKRILDGGIDHDLWIVGEGEERQKVEQFIEENNLGDSVRLFGFRRNPYCFMREADILACSSDYEGFSTFITEGLILGKPIVTTDVSGMRELLGDSEYGIITKIDDNSFYEGLKQILECDETEINSLSLLSSMRGKDFVTEQLVENTQYFFEKIVKEKEV